MTEKPEAELDRLRAENADLRRQLEARDGELAVMRHVLLDSGRLPPALNPMRDMLRDADTLGRA